MARRSLGSFGIGGRHDSLGFGGDLSTLLGGGGAEELIEAKERHAARQELKLDYSFDNMELMREKKYRAEAKPFMDSIKQRHPHLKLYHSKGEQFWEFKNKKHDVKHVDIWRIAAPDGYCFDYELDEMFPEDDEPHTAVHVKFIMQRDTNLQGNGVRMHRHVLESTDILFSQGISLCWGKAARINQFDVRNTRHGDNWRSSKVRIRDAHGNLSDKMIRLLATYLRNGWILFGDNNDGEKLIAFLSRPAIEKMIAKIGEEETHKEFKFYRSYEKFVTDHEIR